MQKSVTIRSMEKIIQLKLVSRDQPRDQDIAVSYDRWSFNTMINARLEV